jgi:hypothetical protein
MNNKEDTIKMEKKKHTKEGEHNKTRKANRNKRKKNNFPISVVSIYCSPITCTKLPYT